MGQRRSVPVFASLMALPAKPPPFNNEVRRQLSVEYADSSSHKNIKGILKKPKTKSLENPEIVGGSVLNHTTNGCFILGRNHVRRPPT